MLAGAHAHLGDVLSAERDLKRARVLGADRDLVTGELARIYLAERRFKDLLTEVPATGGRAEMTARNMALRARAQLGLGDIGAAVAALATAF